MSLIYRRNPIRICVHLIYTDMSFAFEEHFERLSRYADALNDVALQALEEAVLVVVLKIYHAE